MKTIKIGSIAKTVIFAVAAAAIPLGLAGPAEAASGTTYGDPGAAAKWWRHQKYDDCVLMAAADVIGQMTGKEPSEDAIIKKAQSTPSTIHPGSIYIKPSDTKDLNSGQGTMFGDVPTLLKLYNVYGVVSDEAHAAKTGVPSGIEGIEQLLGTGHKVMVSVNAELIWNIPVDTKDENGNPIGDHAVVVTGVDAAYNIVHLNDSGDPNGRDSQIPMALFMRAWEASHELIVATM
ncbi:hypothetical protein [Mycobacterium nebraskense]|uniref:Peptidase C39-like domain-containing protein n=1 Tax=Mycobacterium nebraskense TaxID=244292 RepID=A0A0F5N697_9MYCO|nr:hypothetical protein [Mycobacterium nebraskense]KKC01778.1 hypothetical protein WU83_27590 [Mycobacterium nebraskense]KLO45727.1 hypothetical protein ABW17_06810 [Mycobacterium nebraskense]MBI2696121.1 hypothetical protein [Mycobacterium nebraskense]MCV7120293.1 hypothetical protein [Mycobacterium nebraskense]ORW22278.1 hypothetical protein AWC17_05010 [Mycobacterium nebraskense]